VLPSPELLIALRLCQENILAKNASRQRVEIHPADPSG
jgi:hypothetical protein